MRRVDAELSDRRGLAMWRRFRRQPARRLRTLTIFAVLACFASSTGSVGATTADGLHPPRPQDPDTLPGGVCAPDQPGVIYGTPGRDLLRGTEGDDVICGLDGKDVVIAKAGQDLIVGGGGNDRISAGTGDDVVFGRDGKDLVDGGDGEDQVGGDDGSDILVGSTGNDVVDGGSGNDVIVLGAGDDNGYGGEGKDIVAADDGNDVITGDDGHDWLLAGPGDDFLDGGANHDLLDGSAGTDRCTTGEWVFGCEDDQLVPFDPTVHPVDPAVSAPPLTIEVDDVFPGFGLTIDSGGGILPWEVEVQPARAHMHEVLGVLAGPAFDISVPDTGIVNSATLSLPYDEARLQGPEEELSIWTYDEERQFWVPATGTQTVDPVANTVTTQVQEFSVYAVLGIHSAFGWQQIFQRTPLRCGGGEGGALDVALLVDTSSSMGTSDPTGLRVDGASQFVDAMGPEDRASVITFSTTATTHLGLTSTGTPEGVVSIKAALENGRTASGGTSIGAAVSAATDVLANNGGGGRLRVAVLLTDGQSSYDDALTEAAAAQGIEIHTIGLGDGVDAELLERIATGTGATFRQLSDPAQLPALYRELAGDIIGDETDDDADLIPDCVERNGAFTPRTMLFNLGQAEFIATDPADQDSDDDGLIDGVEIVRTPLADDLLLAALYGFLVEQGLDSYYRFFSDPNDADSDDDGLNDGLEVANGTDPLGFDPNELGIDGLDLPPFTLFQSSLYDDPDERPAVPSRYVIDDEDEIDVVFYNDTPVLFDADHDCVETCDAIDELVAERGNDNGFGVCVRGVGDCTSDTEQERDIVEEARVAQGVFDDSGFISEDFLKEQAYLQCILWAGNQEDCQAAALFHDFDDTVSPDEIVEELVPALALATPGFGQAEVDDAFVQRVAEALILAGLVQTSSGVDKQTATEVTLRQCHDSGFWRAAVAVVPPEVHPCEALPIFSPGGEENLAEYTQHNFDAIVDRPERALLTYGVAEDPGHVSSGWYTGQPGCTAAEIDAAEQRFGVSVACDEMPYFATTDAGPGASLRPIPRRDNSAGGGRNGNFTTWCYPTRGHAVMPPPRTPPGPIDARVPYLVIPRPGGGPTANFCPQRGQ